jgi:hypothetical protein
VVNSDGTSAEGPDFATNWIARFLACHDHTVIGPNLAKARRLPLVLVRQMWMVRAGSARWGELFEHADVMSEGRARAETSGQFWYGTTSLILPAYDCDVPLLAAIAARDMHIRVRAIRVACREASLRAPARLGRLACEVQVKPDSRGVRIDVDVQAPLIEWSARTKAAR